MAARSSVPYWRRTISTGRLLFAVTPACYARPTDCDGNIGPGGRTGRHAVPNRIPCRPGPYRAASNRNSAATRTNEYLQAYGYADAAADTLSHPNPETGSHRHAGTGACADCHTTPHSHGGPHGNAHRHTRADLNTGPDRDSDATAHRHADRHPHNRFGPG